MNTLYRSVTHYFSNTILIQKSIFVYLFICRVVPIEGKMGCLKLYSIVVLLLLLFFCFCSRKKKIFKSYILCNLLSPFVFIFCMAILHVKFCWVKMLIYRNIPSQKLHIRHNAALNFRKAHLSLCYYAYLYHAVPFASKNIT